jgi:transcriptional regulator with XRE-family HTH domain
MFSPYVRRHRLAAELRKLREERDLSTDEVARLVFQSRTKISKLENAQIRPDVGEIMTLLEALGIEGERYDMVLRLARDAARKSWWDKYGAPMGPRQRLYTDLESGARTIHSYDQSGIHGALQIPEFIAELIKLDQAGNLPLSYRPERMTEARLRRQQHLLGQDGPTLEVILEEFAIYRIGVPRSVMSTELRFLISVLTAHPRITFQVLRYNAQLIGGYPPRVSFTHFTFYDQTDLPTTVVDTVTTDLVLTAKTEVGRYNKQYELLRKAALSPEETITFLTQLADRFDNGMDGPG